MKITDIYVANVLGIRTADLRLAKPVALFTGPNGAGKSSLQEAVRMALTGDTVRVALKKEYGSLVTEGPTAARSWSRAASRRTASCCRLGS